MYICVCIYIHSYICTHIYKLFYVSDNGFAATNSLIWRKRTLRDSNNGDNNMSDDI